MRLVIFGASGRTGTELVRQALAQGHQVKAFVRDPARLRLRDQRVTAVVGDVTDAGAVSAAVAGQDAALSALGARTPFRPYPAFRAGVRHLVGALQDGGVRRLVYLSFLGVRAGRRQLRRPFALLSSLLLRGSIADHEANEAVIQASGLDWTIVRAARLTSRPGTGRWQSGGDLRVRRHFPSIPRADLAAAMLALLADPGAIRQTPAVVRSE